MNTNLNIDKLSVDKLSIPTLASTLLAGNQSTGVISGYSVNNGLAICESSGAPPIFNSTTSAARVVGTLVHGWSIDAQIYVIPLLDTDSYPFIFFETATRKMSGTGLSEVTMSVGTSSGTDTNSSNYTTYYYEQTAASALTSSSVSGPFQLGEVYSSVTDNVLRQSYTHGSAYLKSGRGRPFHIHGNTSSSTIFGFREAHALWGNTSDIVTHLSISVPSSVNVEFIVYQR